MDRKKRVEQKKKMYQPYKQFLRDEISPLNTQGFWAPPEPPQVHPNEAERAKLVPLYKEDFDVLRNGGLALRDHRFAHKEAFVIFIVDYCMPCQDTKQMGQAFAVDAHELIDDHSPFIRTDFVQYLMFKRRDGVLVEYRGRFNISKMNRLLAQRGLNEF